MSRSAGLFPGTQPGSSPSGPRELRGRKLDLWFGDNKALKQAVAGLYDFIDAPDNSGVVMRLGLTARRAQVQAERVRVGGADYRAGLVGTLGVQPFLTK